MLERPVQIVQLQLAEFHIFSIGFEEAAENIRLTMTGESEMADLTFVSFLDQVIVDAIFRIEICINIHFTYVMEKVEIEVIVTGLLQLFREDLLYLRHIREIIPRELIREIITVARVLPERLAQDDLRVAVMVSECCIKVIDSCVKSLIHHLLCKFHIDLAVISVDHGKTHGAKAECRKLNVLKISIQHRKILLHFAVIISLTESRRHAPR